MAGSVSHVKPSFIASSNARIACQSSLASANGSPYGGYPAKIWANSSIENSLLALRASHNLEPATN